MTRLNNAERFWFSVEKTPDHWLWAGSKTKDGYGQFGAMKAHVFSLSLSLWQSANRRCLSYRVLPKKLR